jgi:uncharacterized membrane protein
VFKTRLVSGHATRQTGFRLADWSWNVSGTGLLVFGVWLALCVDGYELWDGWILGALGLFVVASLRGLGAPRSVGSHGRRQRGGAAGAPGGRLALAPHGLDRGDPRPDDLEARRMSVLAIVRPDDWNLALFVHVLGAMVIVGALVLAASYLFAARRGGSLQATRVGFRSLLYVALPSFVAMRVGAQWIADEEGVADSDAAWIEIGYIVSDTARS